jgi:hypothetical protein
VAYTELTTAGLVARTDELLWEYRQVAGRLTEADLEQLATDIDAGNDCANLVHMALSRLAEEELEAIGKDPKNTEVHYLWLLEQLNNLIFEAYEEDEADYTAPDPVVIEIDLEVAFAQPETVEATVLALALLEATEVPSTADGKRQHAAGVSADDDYHGVDTTAGASTTSSTAARIIRGIGS